MKINHFLVLPMALTMLTDCSPRTEEQESPELAGKIARFAPTEIQADLSRLSSGDRQALAKLVDAARLMDSIYTHQIWSGNAALRAKLEADTSPRGKQVLEYYNINMGPWVKIDHDSAFVEGVPAKRPLHANYYPDDMTKEEFEQWKGTLSADDQKKATGFFYAVRRDPAGKLSLVPYNSEYSRYLEPAATLLREAASLTGNASLRKYLSTRADAFLSNDYYESDVAWMDLDSPVEPTIGPYEVYMDGLFNYKAAFEAFITLRNDEETANLQKYSQYLQEIENNLPIKAVYRNPALGALAPIRVVDEVAVGGGAREGVQTAAFNLPNDERVTAEKGSKRVMLRNVQQAKFHKVLLPIAQVVLDPGQLPNVSFEQFFTHILAHELMHGLGPHNITVKGEKTTVRQAMKELSSAMEEAKADVSGLFALQYLIDKGVVAKETEEKLYTTFLASVFRTLRFGITEAHGRGMALQINYLMDEGGFAHDPGTGRYSVNLEKVKPAVKKLTSEIMTIQAEGDYARAKQLLETYAVVRPEMKKTLESLTEVPVDIRPIFQVVE